MSSSLLNSFNSFLGGPILGVFLLGMLNSTASWRGSSAWTDFDFSVGSKPEISFFYYAVVGTLVTLGGGWLFGQFSPARDTSDLAGLVHAIDPPPSSARVPEPEFQ